MILEVHHQSVSRPDIIESLKSIEESKMLVRNDYRLLETDRNSALWKSSEPDTASAGKTCKLRSFERGKKQKEEEVPGNI